jgi:hypothetical protein
MQMRDVTNQPLFLFVEKESPSVEEMKKISKYVMDDDETEWDVNDGTLGNLIGSIGIYR